MDKPRIEGALGLTWRPRKNAWAAIWIASKKGYKPATRQIAVFDHEPTLIETIEVRRACIAFQKEMYGEKPAKETGTLRSLIVAYQTDPDSLYQGLEFYSRKEVDTHCRHLTKDHGDLKLAEMGARDLKRIYEQCRWPKGKDDSRGKVSLANKRIGTVRRVIGFGLAYEVDPHCVRLRPIFKEMKFENGKPREEAMTLRQCEDIIAVAHEEGLHSIALAQAIQFDWGVRRKDVIGTWIPETEPGISVIPPLRGWKWLRGMRHEEISSTLKISHLVSKSWRRGEVLERNLTLYPMILAEYERIPVEARKGPLVICELTGRPWKQNNFRDHWRRIATKAGVPADVWNMDSRAGRITETIEATGGNIEAARKEAGHTDQKMTARYSRRNREAIDESAVIVADFRAKNKV